MQAAKGQHLATDCVFSSDDAEAEALALNGARLFCLRHNDVDRVGVLRRHDHVLAGLDDARLLAGDRADRVAEMRHVIEIYRRDDGYRGLDNVGCVESTAHADFDDGHVDRCVGEGCECHACHRLEERQPDGTARIDEVEERHNLVVDLDEPLRAQRFPVDRDALGDRLEMRAGVTAGAQVEAARSVSIMRDVDVLPFVPATWTT